MLFLFVGSALFGWMAPVAAESSVLIGEVSWAGSSKSTADEWIELWNLGDEPVDLTGYKLLGAGGSSGIPFGANDIIPPRSAYLISNYAGSDPKSSLAIEPQKVTSAVSVSNDHLAISLLDADGVVLDTIGDGGTPIAGSSTPTRATMIRTLNGTWVTATTHERLDVDVADFGTPGICDECFATPTSTEAATTTPETVMTTSTTETPPATTTEPIITAPIPESAPPINTAPISFPDIRLHRIFPAPPSGEKEWVELLLPGADPSILDGYALYDATGRIALFPLNDPSLQAQTDRIIQVRLTSAKLNNGGDTVELRRPNGSVVERMTYEKTPSGDTWTKNSDGTAWVLESNDAIDEAEAVQAPIPSTIELPISSPGDADVGTPAARSSASTDGVTSAAGPGDIEEARGAQAAGPVTVKPKTAPKRTVTKPKTTTKKVAKTIATEITMLTKIEPNTRVTLRGTVATKPGLLGKHQYVLLAPDGHGLFVRGTSKQVSPPLGANIRITGTLTFNDDGVSLGVSASDRWLAEKERLDPASRLVNFMELDLEDGWSLVDVTGTVREIKTTSALLDLGDALVSVSIKAASGYRAARLTEGDVIRVRGLLDDRGDEPTVVLRSAEDLEIISHAALAKADAPKPAGLPNWTPFGAAGFTVAITQGFKRLKRMRDEKRIRDLASASYGSS